MEHITLPSTIQFQAGDRPNTGMMLVTPCHQGYGTTLGNALRRVLLSSLPGAAVESVKVAGVQHEFSAVPGVKEDMIEIILNLKQMAVKVFSDTPVTLHFKKKGTGTVTADDFEKNADVEIINPELMLATMTDAKIPLEMDITVGKGFGYVPVSEKETRDLDLGTIAIDSLYTPIRDVGYHVEMTRVGDVTNYEKLTMTIETNGTVAPEEAVHQATNILMQHFALILETEETNGTKKKTKKAKNDASDEVAEVENGAEEEIA